MSEKREALTGFPFFMALYQLYLKVSFSEILKNGVCNHDP